MKPRVWVSYGLAILILWFLIEVIWGASGGALAGLWIARDPAFQQKVDAFFKQRGLTPATPEEARAAVEKLSPEDRAAFQRMVKDALRDSPIGGFWMTVFVSAAAFGIAAFVAGSVAREWRYAWTLVVASAVLNNPLRRFGMVANMPLAQKAVVVAVQVGVSFGAAWLGSRLSRRRSRDIAPETMPENA